MAEAGSAPRDALTISIHIPKTAGVRFGEILRNEHGDACALYYGPHDERTHPLLRVRPRELDAARLDALAASGVEVLHGHVKARHLVGAIADPARYVVWLREPIEQALSRFHQREPHAAGATRRAADAPRTVEEYVQLPEAAGFQTDYVRPLALETIGFVGITELFEPMLALLDLDDTAHRANVNPHKPLAGRDVRARLVPHLSEDIALYSEALEIAIRSLGLRDVGERARYKRSAAKLARRFGADIPEPKRRQRHEDD